MVIPFVILSWHFMMEYYIANHYYQVRLSDMIFYDNLNYNLTDVEAIPAINPDTGRIDARQSVVTVHTPRGLRWDNFVEGLCTYEEARRI